MHDSTIKIVHWIWGEPKLADFMREVAAGEKIPPDGEIFEYGDDRLAAWISDFVFPENRNRGILAWRQIGGSEERVAALYRSLTNGRATPAGRLEWLSETEWDLIRDALLGHEGSSKIYVHPTVRGFHPYNRYRVYDKNTVYEMGWSSPSGAWGMSESERQICPTPAFEPCGCTVMQRER